MTIRKSQRSFMYIQMMDQVMPAVPGTSQSTGDPCASICLPLRGCIAFHCGVIKVAEKE